MNKNITLSISTPCSEKWENFAPSAQGGFCSSCSKTVIDFTGMEDEDVIAFFAGNTGHTCGRFRPNQLKTYAPVPLVTVRPGFSLLKAAIISMFMLLISKHSPAQDVMGKTQIALSDVQAHAGSHAVNLPRIIKGVVKDEVGESMPGVNVLLKGTTTGTTTNADGKFELRADVTNGDMLVFTFIGYKYEEYKIKSSDSDVIDITMKMEAEIMGSVAVVQVHEPEPSGFRKLWLKVKNVF